MPETSWMGEFFNQNLKGKYAYWVQMRYIFPLESLDYKTYIKFEQLDRVHFLGPDMLKHIDLYSDECCMYDFAQNYIDHSVTEEVNSIKEYISANEYVADFDIDLVKIRQFRTWLADELLKFNTGFDGDYLNKYTPEQIHVLEYYKNDMYNDIIKYLSVFGNSETTLGLMTNGCGCCNSNISSLYNLNTIGLCDAQKIYIDNLHKAMVLMFEDVNFWKQFNIDFIKVFKKYIDNIIKTGMIIYNTSDIIKFTDCNCSSQKQHETNERMLRNLSESLEFIINDDINGHLNFISDSLHNWAEYLYDYMSWQIN
jgi:hypothetical protein